MTQAERKRLTESLPAIRRVLGHAGIFGGREVTTATEFERRITRLLEPENAAALANEADAFTAVNLPFIAKARVCAERTAAEIAEAEAERKRVIDIGHEKQAAAIQERKDRELAMRAVRDQLG
jgi:hypothetical protein